MTTAQEFYLFSFLPLVSQGLVFAYLSHQYTQDFALLQYLPLIIFPFVASIIIAIWGLVLLARPHSDDKKLIPLLLCCAISAGPWFVLAFALVRAD